LDVNRIQTLEKKVEELNRNMVQLALLVRKFLASDPKLMIANNLLKEVFKSEQDPKLVKIITCNKKYASEIKDVVGRLSDSLGVTMDHLVKHKDRLKFKVEEIQRSNPEVRKVFGTSETGARSLSGIKVAVTSSGSTSNASKSMAAVESIQET
jgi:hypothetical protein